MLLKDIFSARRTVLAAIALSSVVACRPRPDSTALRAADGEPFPPAAAAAVLPPAPRLEADSGWLPVAPGGVDLHLSYSGFKPKDGSITEGERVRRLNIGKKALAMLNEAKTTIVASAFLFDSMYSTAPESTEAAPTPVQIEEERKITQVFRDLLVKKRQENPQMLIAVVLDPINRAYVDRISDAAATFRKHGIDVFYSDLASTPAVGVGNLAMQKFQELHRSDVHVEDLSAWAFETIETAFSAARVLEPMLGASFVSFLKQLPTLKSGKSFEVFGQKLELDGQPVNLELIYNVALLKANHRKLLVVDKGADYEALVSSANPHNASFGAANSALSVVGTPARYVYNSIRADVVQSVDRANAVAAKYAAKPEKADRLARRFAAWSDARADAGARDAFLATAFPVLAAGPAVAAGHEARFVTEAKIADSLVEMLGAVDPDDRVRIQMFYLAYPRVLDAIVAAAKVVSKPVQLILDPNKDAFNKTKDGTPNRQVARWLLARAAQDPSVKLALRWYSTHGEQNHAKIMSISGPAKNRWQIVTGSANWTGKNIGGANMEANLVVRGGREVNEKFDAQFDVFWANSEPGIEYTIAYDDPRYRYHEQTADDSKWTNGEKSGLVAW